MLALRTSFVALVYDQDDPVLDEILIWGGGMEPIESPADFQGGQTFTLVCFVYSETEDDIQANLDIVWEQSTNEGATWTAKTIDTRVTKNWAGGLYGGVSGQVEARYFDVAWLTVSNFKLEDVGQYRLRVDNGVLDEAYSPGKVRIRLDSNPG
ncbi:hypothetical protein CMI37_21060 [Candidatus Pacearchaeota archaeon]|nr:hypothetical protein [Candidatus Pacearchaeota archaeon]